MAIDTGFDESAAEGAFATIAALAEIDDLDRVADAYRETMRAAYWDDKDVHIVVAVAYAGVSRLLTEAARVEVVDEVRARVVELIAARLVAAAEVRFLVAVGGSVVETTPWEVRNAGTLAFGPTLGPVELPITVEIQTRSPDGSDTVVRTIIPDAA